MANLPIEFNAVTTWVDYTDPTNVPTEVRVLSASDLLRYENFGTAAKNRINDHETRLSSVETTQSQNGERLSAVEATNTSQGNSINDLQEADATRGAQITALTRGTVIRASTSAYTVSVANRIHIHTAGSAAWTLPAISGNVGQDILIHNKGAGTLTVSSAAANGIYTSGSAGTSITLSSNQSTWLVNDGAHWVTVMQKTV